jgi:branched-chain amino acid transport system permease protein
MIEWLNYLALPVTLFGIYAIQAMSLQLILGGAGLLSLGHAAYFAVGAYASGVFTQFIAPSLGVQSPILLLLGGLFCSFVAAGLAGLIVALPCLRLQGDYLAMATLGFGEIVATIFQNLEAVGGTRGFKDVEKLTSPAIIWIGAALVALFLHRFYQSGLGMAVLATRDDEIAARSVGISTQRAKTLAFVLGSAIAGLSGSFHIHTLQIIAPTEATFLRSVEIALAVVMGGMYSIRGSILGAFILVSVPEMLRFAPDVIAQNRMLIFAVVVIVLMIVNPRGLSDALERVLSRRSQGLPAAGSAR